MPVHNNPLFIQLNLYAGSLPQVFHQKKNIEGGERKKKN